MELLEPILPTLKLVLRWVHVFAAILWIGQTHLFGWLERTLHKNPQDGGVWMVHGGGFFFLEKQTAPEQMPTHLHWFRFESLITWLTGFSLLILVYWTGGVLVDPDNSTLSQGAAAGVAFASLAVPWPIYTSLCKSAIGRDDRVVVVIGSVLLVAFVFLLCEIFVGRAAYIHVGAMLGTIMVMNVWQIILPAQRKMVAELREGKTPDLSDGAEGKRRSKHNTYLVVPVVFIMISNHFSVETYAHDYNAFILCGLILVGFGAAHALKKV